MQYVVSKLELSFINQKTFFDVLENDRHKTSEILFSFKMWNLPLLFYECTLPFFLNSGFPFLTVASTMSPTPAEGSRFNRPFIPLTAMMYKFLAPEIKT